MQSRFHRDARVKATELVLEERRAQTAPPVRSPATVMPTAARSEPRVDVVEHVGLRGAGPMRVHLLGHGELSSLVCATGAGVTTWKGLDVNRFREEPLLEAGGIYFYVKNHSAQRLWSAAYQPTRAEPNFYNVAFSIDRVEFHRRDGDVQTVTEIALSPEHAVEIRRITLSNFAAVPQDIEITSYTEVVLAGRGSDVAHRAFGSLFVETEALPERGALLARRRPRLLGEPEVWMVQVLIGDGDGWSPLDYDSSRAGFVGRGRGTDDPQALSSDRPLAKQTGRVLDPALALRRSIRLAPATPARLTLITGLAPSRDEALALIDTYSAQHGIARAIELGWAGVRVELRHLGITAAEVHRFQRLLSATIFPDPSLRVSAAPANVGQRGTAALWAQGISGDLPIVLCRIDHADFADLCRDLLLAHEFWRLNGFVSDLVIINDEPSGYLQPTQDTVRDLIRQEQIDQRGGVFLRRSDQMSEEERQLLYCAARVVLRSSDGSLARQLRRAATSTRDLPPALSVAEQPSLKAVPTPPIPRPKLDFDNGFGGFDEAGRHYVMLLGKGRHTPAPWCNVMANPDFGSLVSEVGSSFTWFKNSQRHRLTPWSNDTVSDPSGELLYVRDDNDGSFWSATPEPLGGDAEFVVRHAQGFSTFTHTRRALSHELTFFVSASEPIKLVRLRIQNLGPSTRRLSVFGLVEWVLGTSRESSRISVASAWNPELGSLSAHNPLGLFPTHRAFYATDQAVLSFSADREEFFGVGGSRQAPDALTRTRLSGSVGAGLDPCAALQVALEIEPGKTGELTFFLGQAASGMEAEALITKYRQPGAVARGLEQAQQSWDDLVGAVKIKTPDPALDTMQNHWLLYQSVSSRLWGRTGFYQSSGAYGYRDQLQDVLASVHSRPSIAREHLLRSAVHQFAEGDVQHWWHDETGQGLRTHCSDDMLWLPFVVAQYVLVTGDRAVLDESLPFLTERVLAAGEEDMFSAPALSEARASLYEHCTRALDVGMSMGPHGLPLMGGGDWNDGMNRVGHEGRGESVWLAWFIAKILKDFGPIAESRGDRDRAAWCRQHVTRLAQVVDEHAWDGAWYRRAYFDDGTPLGSKQNSECSIDAIAQSWAVIAGNADKNRAAAAVAASEASLISERDQLMRLLTTPFEHTVPDPGYIQAYPPGVRENGGQYTHGVLWTVLALTLLGEGDRAGALLSLLNPIRHGDTPENAQRYRVEPYVVAADVYSSSEHGGRGGWTWYTGSAGWMYRIVLENVLGLKRRGKLLSMAPCIPRAWSGFEIEYRYERSTYRIRVENPEHVSHGVARVELDGKPLTDGTVRLVDDERVHEVTVRLGQAELSRFERVQSAGGLGT
jgi:cyclic beta-1,2-glucan glucanotransferase